MQKEKQRSKQFQSLRRDINGLLRDFQKNKQWADFSNWLHRLYEELSKKRFAELPQQITLCKRLAQCLNPSLPAGVHTTVLKVYEVILKNFGNKTQMLPLIALGLFPFFEHSNYANKLALVKLFDEHFVNETQSVQMIVGLTAALLTGLNENSDEFTKKIYAFFDKFAKNYGKIWIDGAVWINILKSPKVRLAGFKYFMKVFKDRDRVLLNPVEQSLQQQQSSQEKVIVQTLQNKIDHSQLKEQQKVMLMSLHGYRSRPDQNFTRFPNFSTLIVNTLCVCLDNQAEQMVKRSTLDLLINYLKINTKIFQRADGVLILQKMLLLLQTKEYNLTNRVYKYLFDQPNAQGQFFIDFEKKSLELQVLKQALLRLLQYKNHSKGESVLLIIQIILADHPILTEFLLTRLSFQMISFIREFYVANFKKQNLVSRSMQDFYLSVIAKNKKIFLQSIIKIISQKESNKVHIEKEKANKQESFSIEIMLDILQFYFNRLQKISLPPKQKPNALISQQQEVNESREIQEYKFVRTIVIQQLIQYTYKSYPCPEKLLISILDLSNQLLVQFLASQSQGQALTSKQIEYIQQLLEKQKTSQKKIIYSKLITLLPQPKKEQLLPYIEDSSLSIVCINILLGGGAEKLSQSKLSNKGSIKNKDSIKSKDSIKLSQKQSFFSWQPIPLTKDEQKLVFTAIFKLLNCHLFQSKALQFIERFRNHYIESFNLLIDTVNPSQWLIYWNKVEGNVSGGIIRMLQNLDSQNSYYKHLSRKWVVQSQTIISKVIEPLYNLMKTKQRKMSIQDQERVGLPKSWNIQAYDKVYTLMKLVFRNTSTNFSKFFFLQRDKFLNTFIIYVFKCIETDSFEAKSKSLQMITFLLDQTRDFSQKFDMVNLTLANVISILNKIIDTKYGLKGQEENTILTLSNFQIELLQYISKIISNICQIIKNSQFRKPEQIIKILKNSNIYAVIMIGMEKTETSYIKTLYMDSSKEIAQMIAQLDNSKTQITNFMSKILEQLFSMLKSTEMNTIEDIIRSRNGHSNLKESIVRRKKSYNEMDQPDTSLSFYQEGVKQDQIRHNLNLQQKYGEIIELWNAVKFYILFAIKLQLKEMPVMNLISLILQSFPFSYLKYTRAGGVPHQTNLELLEEQISNVTGLKKEVLEIFEILWNKQSRQILDFLIEKGDPRILVHSSLDPSKVLQTFNKNSKMKQVLKYIRNNKFSLPKNTLHYNFENLNKQNQLLYFVYVYFLYFNMKSFKNKRVNYFFEAFNEFLRAMKSTSHIQSKLWLLQIIELISQRMMVNKDVNIQNWSKIKQDIQDITKQLLDQIVCIINKSKLFTHRFQIKTGLFGLFGKEEKENSLYDFIKMFPPSIFESYEKYLQNMKRISKNKEQLSRISQQAQIKSNFQIPRERLYAHIIEDDKIIFQSQSKIDEYLFVRFLNRSQNQYIHYLGLCSLKTLIRIGNSLLINVYDKDATKINLIIKEILINLLPICENRSPENQHYNQLIAQYLHTVLQNQQLRLQIIKIMRKNILDVFMANDFFKCTQKTLYYWKGVIDYCTQNYDLLGQLLSSEGLLQGMFTKKAESTRQKIKSFERVCFVIYSGKIDKYENKLRTVLQSLNDVMKQQNSSPALLILILFCIRILFMRLSTISLNKLFRSVWPSLITLLIQIFKKEKSAKNVNLQLAALKVIELVHALQLEQFMLHKWMFVFDYFGVRIDPMGDIEDNMANCQILTPFVFKPFLTNALPNTRLKCKFMPEKSDVQYERFMTKRRLIVKKTNVQNEDQLRQYSVLLMQYMMDLNEYRCQISKNDIENLIEDDFISLDDYIFKMK